MATKNQLLDMSPVGMKFTVLQAAADTGGKSLDLYWELLPGCKMKDRLVDTHPPAVVVKHDFRTVISKDGTKIGFYSFGKGPGVIVLPGVLSMASDYVVFASALAGRQFSVHILERRGRGSSGPQGGGYGIQMEIDDLFAVQRDTGADLLVGHSYGGLIALEAGRNNTSFRKIAVYEPGVSIEGSMPVHWMPGYEKKLAENRKLDALVEFTLADAPARLAKLPQWLMKWMLRLFFLRYPAARQMLGLLQQNLLEWREIAKLDGHYLNYREVSAAVLLLYGGRSDSRAVDVVVERLPAVIPHCETKLFPKLDHFGIERTAPKEVAKAIGEFFSR
jgi:pimeloyl-ACP methyl ester carboxylesterase